MGPTCWDLLTVNSHIPGRLWRMVGKENPPREHSFKQYNCYIQTLEQLAAVWLNDQGLQQKISNKIWEMSSPLQRSLSMNRQTKQHAPWMSINFSWPCFINRTMKEVDRVPKDREYTGWLKSETCWVPDLRTADTENQRGTEAGDSQWISSLLEETDTRPHWSKHSGNGFSYNAF